MTEQENNPTGRGSVRGAPGLPDGFADTFRSAWVQVGDLRLHAVTGGDGPPLLLLAGWPQTWYAWRELMPALARDFSVVAADPRGVGLSGKPDQGYDTGTLAADMVGLMSALGHHRFAMVGHDVGMWTGYALAADHPERLERLAVAEAVIPGLAPSPPLFAPQEAIERLWHFGFNRLGSLNEQLVQGRERLFFGHQFTTKAAQPLPEHAVELYIETLASDREALRASFEFYRAIDTTIEQNTLRRQQKLTMPVLTIAGARSVGELVGATMAPAAVDVTSVVLPDCGHFPAEEAPQDMLAALSEFLAPYRRSALASG
ncbi:alpha/beta fold hydrolase [Kutzneria albida]|uniref:alpha/beta fold hydrolase n=1 Tax=Kutzneria albida TaxID=43357 RepID=UPI00046D163F|nr:alpha/beta hydrolase [Kutzneria albida]